MNKPVLAAVAVVLTPLLVIVIVLALASNNIANGQQCGIGAVGERISSSSREIGQWNTTQVSNAIAIMNAGADLGMTQRDQEIAVTTAIGESTLTVIDHGDAAGPDSRGLFQQRDNGAWGTYEDRMDPHTSATMFYEALKKIDNRDSLSITEAAHRVQGNADPNHYAAYEDEARELIAAIRGGQDPDDAEGEGSPAVGTGTNCAGPAGGEGIPDQNSLGDPSTDIACPEGTTDLGVHDGAFKGARVPIRLCSITGTVCTGSDCREGDLGGLARGEVVINARYAPYFQAWLATLRSQGYDPVFSSSFRSWASQARISGGGSNANAAVKGRSHHQTGGAVDVSGLPGSYNKNQCTGKTSDGACMTSGDLWAAMHAAGLQHGLSVHDQEFWHFEFLLSGEHRGRTNPFTTL
ncbi:hypothetical protein V1260_15425 [Brachybacterium sp. J144]|uniref:hypothetical protein n=1 Tax=Brachybacterium sp. J144 TaxID=3116487 RepID=UPI002E7A50B8|nr:hypothetical protein [Brachybacterium sp. J144]MEE1652172.1 hypothetical protein [Brachybacterium sp. J144]